MRFPRMNGGVAKGGRGAGWACGWGALVAVALVACGSTAGPAGGAQGDGGADGGAALADGGTPARAPAALAAYSGGSCPELTAGSSTFQSGGKARQLLVSLPAEPRGAGLLFLWHGLGDSPANFAAAFRAETEARARNLVIVVPTPITNILPTAPPSWGFIGDGTADLALFDDVRACAAEKLGVDPRRVYTMGFSAGALWSTYLLIHRGDSLAAATIFSGGATQTGTPGPRYETPAYKVPALLSEGGTNDVYAGIVHFDQMVELLFTDLTADGHVVVRCDHTGGHMVPRGGTSWGYDFLAAHTFGAPSPYAGATVRPAPYPDICTFPGMTR